MSTQYDAWNRLAKISDGTSTVENVYDARGYRIRKDSYTGTALNESRHYYYTPGWQVVEERLGSTATAERQYVWGLRYIDDLVIRDRDATGSGSINERRYGMQDGNWNMMAICDITGAVGERYAYAAYGSPVFMNGSGAVQTSSAIGFETLYAGYRWDGASPQIYYVRNRFLLPFLGTWNRRDPLGYVDGMNLYRNCRNSPIHLIDPLGLFDGGATAAVGTGVLINTAAAGSGLAATTGTMGGSSLVIATLPAEAAAAGAGGGGVGLVGAGIAAPAALLAGGLIVIGGVSYGTYSVADPFWEWLFWDDPLAPDPGWSTGPQTTCGPTGGIPISPPRAPGEPRGRPRRRRTSETCEIDYRGWHDCNEYEFTTYEESVFFAFGNGVVKGFDQPEAAHSCGDGQGLHYKMYRQSNDRFLGSVICCGCCRNSENGPVFETGCNAITR